ncbi:MAG: type I-MYXAN CRISPR-associated protein Cas6/Cmx6 [Pseudomonadota bacterium]
MPQNDNHVVDLFFHVQGKQVPVDHGYTLYSAISRMLESDDENKWLHRADNIGLLPIRGHYTGQGKLMLDQHARFGLRLPVNLIPKVLKLAGKRLDVDGDVLRVGVSITSALIPAPVLYAHIVTTRNGEDEARFDAEIQRQMDALDIKGKSARGPRRIVTIKDKKVVGYSLLVSELTAEESIRLQEHGLGGRRKMGCGVFVARKDSE